MPKGKNRNENVIIKQVRLFDGRGEKALDLIEVFVGHAGLLVRRDPVSVDQLRRGLSIR